jgi:signal transduction histidine kinase
MGAKEITEAAKVINDLSETIEDCTATKEQKKKMRLLLGNIAYRTGLAHGTISRYEDILKKHNIEIED